MAIGKEKNSRTDSELKVANGREATLFPRAAGADSEDGEEGGGHFLVEKGASGELRSKGAFGGDESCVAIFCVAL